MTANQFEKDFLTSVKRCKEIDKNTLKQCKIIVKGDNNVAKAIDKTLTNIEYTEPDSEHPDIITIDTQNDNININCKKNSTNKTITIKHGNVIFPKGNIIASDVTIDSYSIVVADDIKEIKDKTSAIYINDLLNNIFKAVTVLVNNNFNKFSQLSKVDDNTYSLSISFTNAGLLEKCYVNERDAVELVEASINKPNELFLYSDVDSDMFKRIQKIELMILKTVAKICKENDISYFLAGGTLLGAIRHNGFIPWDYDCDLVMTRDNYDKFVKCMEKELPDEYFLQTPKSEKHNHFFTKVRLNGTKYETPFTSKQPIHNGFFVDIFVHDYTANSTWGQKLHINLTLLTRSMVWNKWGKSKIVGYKKDGSAKFARTIATIIKNILPISFLEWLQFKTIMWFDNCKPAKKYMYDGTGQNIRRGVFPAEWIDELIMWKFEDDEYPVPKEYDKYLKYLYGNYTELISPSERHISHDMVKIDLGKYQHMDIDKIS